MDNCDLEKITISVGTLDPPFQPSITRYKVTVPSNINQVTLNLQTSDCGASYRICFGNGSNVLNVDDGMNQVDIEVVAEDGTSQIYCIEVIKLSASTAKLEDLIVSPDTKLHPTFSANMYEYSCMVNFDCDAVTILPKIPDDNMQVSVNGTHIPGQIRLAVGDTRIETKVCSADGTKSQVYTVLVTRKEIPLAFTFNDVKDRLEYECPVSLTAFYRPVSVSPSEPKHIFSSPYIDMLTRRSKVNPLNELPLKESWRVPELDLDRRMSAALVQCPFHYRGCESLLRLSEAGSHAKGCPCRPPQKLDPKEVTGTEWYKKYFAFSNKLEIETKHTLEMRSWEMRLQTAIGGDDVGELRRHADAQLRQYRERLPEPGHLIRYEDGRVLLDCLERAAIHYASAVRLKPRDPKLHLMLGRVLEQLHYAAEMHGLSRQAEGNAQDLDGAQVAGKEDEVLAICKLHGFSSRPTLEEQLKALDAEYRQLREQGLPAKADYIQTLFIWLSKRAGKGGGARAGSLGTERPLQQALLKFLDAWSLSPDDWELNLHAGRLLLLRGQAREALQHLRTGLALRPSHAPLRFYTGLAMLEQDRDPESKVVAALYLQQGLEHFISLSCNPEGLASADKQDTADLLSLRNTQFLQGCLSLGTLLKDCKRPGNAMSPDQVFHATAVLAARGLCGCMCRGEVARQMDWALLYAHYALLQALIQAQVPGREAWVARRCQALNSLIRLATIAPCRELLDLQEKVCQIGVVATPRSSHALCLLGQVQLARYDHEPDSESVRGSLADCLLSFQASIELEDAIQSGPTPRQLAAQKWWQDHQAKKEMEMSANQTASPLGGAHHGSGARVAGEGFSRARTPGRGCAAATPSRKTEKPASPSAKPTPPVASRGCTGAKPKCPRTPCKTTSKSKPTPMAPKPACQSSEEQLEPQAPKAGELALDHISSAESMMRNCWSHVPRLGLARALSRSANTMEKACTLYQEVIAMAPEVHDAYIELADLLVKSDPLAAVDVYCKFPLRPISEQNFDDAFITGEIVRILMKEEQFDHPQLGPNLIANGKVMGLGGLEKYIDILEGKFKTNLLKTVYAGIHDKSVEDKDLQDFFSFKCWI